MCSINHDLELIFVHTPKCGGLYIQQVLEKFYNFKTYYFTHENHDNFVSKEKNNIDTRNKNINGFLNINKEGVLRYYMSSNKHNLKMNMDATKWNKYKKFAVIRNPYDRFLSAIKYTIRHEENNPIDITAQRHNPGSIMLDDIDEINITNIRDIAKKYIQNSENINIYDYFHIFINQYDNLLDINCKLNIDYLIKFENLNTDLCDILLKSGIDKITHRKALLDNIKINETVNYKFFNYYDENLLECVNTLFNQDFETFGFNKVNTLEELLHESKTYHKNIDDFIADNISLLIDLDIKNSIIKHDELNKDIQNNKNTQICNSNITTPNISENKQFDVPNNILLPNGITINVNQTDTSKKNQIPKNSNFHIKNIIKAINNLGKK